MKRFEMMVNKTVQEKYVLEVPESELQGMDEDEVYNYVMDNYWWDKNPKMEDAWESIDGYDLVPKEEEEK